MDEETTKFVDQMIFKNPHIKPMMDAYDDLTRARSKFFRDMLRGPRKLTPEELSARGKKIFDAVKAVP